MQKSVGYSLIYNINYYEIIYFTKNYNLFIISILHYIWQF